MCTEGNTCISCLKYIPNLLIKKGKRELETLAKNQDKINYEQLVYKIYFNFRSQKTDFSEKFGTLYDLLKNLLTNKIRIENAIADQLYFIINLTDVYDKNDLVPTKIKTHKKNSDFGEDKAFIKANKIFGNAKQKRKRGIKFFSKKV